MELDIVQLGASIVSGSLESGGLAVAVVSLLGSGAMPESLLTGMEAPVL